MKIKGKVYGRPSGNAIANAQVELKSKDELGNTQVHASVPSDDQGEFSIDLSLYPSVIDGKHTISFSDHKIGSRNSTRIDLKNIASAPDLDLTLYIDEHVISTSWGISFVITLFVLLMGLSFGWYWSHKNIMGYDKSDELISLISLVKQQKSSDSLLLRQIPIDSVGKPLTWNPLKNQRATYNALYLLDSSFKVLYMNELCPTMAVQDSVLCTIPPKVSTIRDLIVGAKKSKSESELSHVLNTLETNIKELSPDMQIWTGFPLILLEVLFWAMIGTLIRLIIFNSIHVYNRRFRPYVILRHIALLLCIPILALLISMLMSLVNFSISIGESSLVLDLSNGYIVVLIAALIGFAPWQAWNFVRDFADRLFEILGGWFGKPLESKETTETPETKP